MNIIHTNSYNAWTNKVSIQGVFRIEYHVAYFIRIAIKRITGSSKKRYIRFTFGYIPNWLGSLITSPNWSHAFSTKFLNSVCNYLIRFLSNKELQLFWNKLLVKFHICEHCYDDLTWKVVITLFLSSTSFCSTTSRKWHLSLNYQNESMKKFVIIH